jgi:hypothetical protein
MTENIKYNTNFLFLIFSCQKYRHKALKQKETWLKDFTLMPYFHVIGDPKLTSAYKFDLEEKVLYVKVADDYVSLPKKVIAAYEAIYETHIFQYIFKTDDDQFLSAISFLTTLQKLLLSAPNKIHYAGYNVKIDKAHLSQYHSIHPELPPNLPMLETTYCSGRFYLLSELAVQQLLSKKECINKEYFEDYAIGLYLDPVLKKNILHINTFKYFNDFTETDFC